jgi:hypothetical protein
LLFLLLSPLSLWAQPQFVDQTREAGLGRPNTCGSPQKRYILESTGSGAAFFDYDGDGHLDLYVVNGSTFEKYEGRKGPGNALYRNQGDGRFAEATDQAGVRHGGWGLGAAVGDVDNDGHPDLYVTNYGPNTLYLNQGDGTFADLSAWAGVEGEAYSASAAFFDYEQDGDLDLYVANYVQFDLASVPADTSLDEPCVYLGGLRVYCGPQGMEGAADVLYRNEGDGRFTDVSAAAGISGPASEYYGLGVMPEDYDGDGDVDIFVANDETPNVLWRNEGNGRFAEVAVEAGVAYNGEGDTQAGMGVDAADYDGDGDVDLYVTNFYREPNTLYRNEGQGRFADFTAAAGLAAPTLDYLGWGTKFLDWDNDGDLDLFVVNGHVYPQVAQGQTGVAYAQRNQLFANEGGGRFAEVDGGPGMAQPRVGRGAAFGDYDDDGDVDIFVNNLDQEPTLLRNEGGNALHWLRVQVEGGEGINRDGVGIRVRVRTAAGAQERTIGGAGSYLSYSDPRAHFGLGPAERAEVEIRWPDGKVEQFGEVPADRLLVVRRGRGTEVRELGAR